MFASLVRISIPQKSTIEQLNLEKVKDIIDPGLLVVGERHEMKNCSVVSDSLLPHDYTVYGIFQARKLEWIAFPFSRGSFQPRD